MLVGSCHCLAAVQLHQRKDITMVLRWQVAGNAEES